MNYLAHTLLSKAPIDYRLGNLLADPLKGRAWEKATPLHQEGMKMHKIIDAYTDVHPCVRASQSRLGERRYLKGVIIDIVYDHFLSQHWERYVEQDIELYIKVFYTEASENLQQMPDKAVDFVQSLINYNVLMSYQDFSNLENTFRRIDQRLSARLRAKETASSYFPVIKKHYGAIENDFLGFFPDLISRFIEQAQAKPNEHFFKTKNISN